jgi:hypothetical protein
VEEIAVIDNEYTKTGPRNSLTETPLTTLSSRNMVALYSNEYAIIRMKQKIRKLHEKESCCHCCGSDFKYWNAWRPGN